jgi:hypothetical protein
MWGKRVKCGTITPPDTGNAGWDNLFAAMGTTGRLRADNQFAIVIQA